MAYTSMPTSRVENLAQVVDMLVLAITLITKTVQLKVEN